MKLITYLFLLSCLVVKGQDRTTKAAGTVTPSSDTVVMRLSSFGLSTANISVKNNAAMIGLHRVIRGRNNKPFYRIIVPPGVHRISDPYWLSGVNNFELVGQDTTSALLAESNYFFHQRTIFFPATEGGSGGGSAVRPGIRIKSTPVGASRIYLWNAADTVRFFAGQRVVIGGLERQMYGHPPNWARFEFKRIASVGNDRAGNAWVTITAYVPGQPSVTEFAYDENWKDFTMDAGLPSLQSGKPRLWLLDRKDNPDFVYAKKAVFTNLRFHPWSGDRVPTYHVFVGDSVIWNNPRIDSSSGVVPNATESWVTIYNNPQWNDGIEVDKVNHYVEVNGGYGSSAAAVGNGTRIVKVKNYYQTKWADHSPHVLYLLGNTVNDRTSALPSYFPQPEGHNSIKAVVKNLTFKSPNVIEGHIFLADVKEVIMDHGGLKLVPGEPNCFYIAMQSTRDTAKAFSNPHRMRFWRSDGAKFTRVENIVDAGARGQKVICTPGTVFKPGERWQYSRYQYIIDSGGHVCHVWGVPPFHANSLRWKGNLSDNDSSTRTTVWTEKDFKFRAGGGYPYINVQGTIHRITITVNTPYTAGPASKLIFYKEANNNQYNTRRIFEVDLKQAGTRVIHGTARGGAASGLKAGEYAQPSMLNGFVNFIGYDATATQNTSLPRFRVEVLWTPYTQHHRQR